MSQKKVYAFPNSCTPSSPVTFIQDNCNGCNRCVNVCEVDVFIPSPEKGSPPIVMYPDECWYCGCCSMECPLWEKFVLEIDDSPLLSMIESGDLSAGE